VANEEVSYFVGIQTEFDNPLLPLVSLELETLTNSRTNERMTSKKGWLSSPQKWVCDPFLIIHLMAYKLNGLPFFIPPETHFCASR
jgi:hypothetical protein